jgi:hypothetical protein
MNFIIECDDEQQQIQVLQKLEKHGYHWHYSGEATNFVPITEDARGKTIMTLPQMTLAYTVDPERAQRMHKDSHRYVTGSEYLGKTKVIL